MNTLYIIRRKESIFLFFPSIVERVCNDVLYVYINFKKIPSLLGAYISSYCSIVSYWDSKTLSHEWYVWGMFDICTRFYVDSRTYAESYTTTVFVPRFECCFESKTTCFRDVLNINEHSDVIKHLCLIPLKFVPATPILICYWPCLVFRGVNKAMLSHQKIYPLQHNIQLKLQKKLMQRSLANGNIDDDRFVVLPLSSSHGCFPKTMSTNVLYDVVDHNSLQSHQYWKTVIPKNANQFQGGKNVYRLLENFEVVRAYVREAMTIMSPTSVLGNDLIDTLLEMKRLCRLEIEI